MPETKKLHYNKFLYKMQFRNALAGIFRTEWQRKGNLSYAALKLSEYKYALKNHSVLYKNRWGTKEEVPLSHYRDAQKLYRILRHQSSYMIRCEYNTVNLYSNDLDFLENINKKISVDTIIWKPDTNNINFLLENKNVIIVDNEPEFMYKVTFGRKSGKKELAKWIANNRDKVVCGPRLYESLQNENRCIQSQYIFAKDEKVVLLLQMIVGDNITRIDKLVSKQNIDK